MKKEKAKVKVEFYNNVEVYKKGQHYENVYITNVDSQIRNEKTLFIREAKDMLSKGKPFYNEKEVLNNIFNKIDDAFINYGEESIDIRIPCRVICDWIMKGIIVKPSFQRNSDIKSQKEKSNIIGSLISGDTESLGHIVLALRPNKDDMSIEIFDIQDGHQRTMTFVEFLYDVTLRERLSLYSTPSNLRLSGTKTVLDEKDYLDIINLCPRIKENIDNTMIKVSILHPSRHPDAANMFNVLNGKQTRMSAAESVNASFYQNEFFDGIKEICNKKDAISKINNRLFGGTGDNKRFSTTVNTISAVAFSDYCVTEDVSIFETPGYKSTSANVAKQYLKDLDSDDTFEKIAIAKKVLNKMIKLDLPINFCHSINLNKDSNDKTIRNEIGTKGYPKDYESFYHNGSKCLSIACLVFAAYRYMIENKYTDKEMIEALIPMENFLAYKFIGKHTTLGKSFFMHIDEFLSDIKNYFNK
jgi:hypothetical protein